jgi:hypothetical protein
MSSGFIYVVDAHFIDKIEENKYPGPKCLCNLVEGNILYRKQDLEDLFAFELISFRNPHLLSSSIL